MNIHVYLLDLQDVPSELYGPMMLTLSLVAVLLYGMKSSGHEVVIFNYVLFFYGIESHSGGGHSDWNSLSYLLWLLARCFKSVVLHCLCCQCSLVHGSSFFANGKDFK